MLCMHMYEPVKELAGISTNWVNGVQFRKMTLTPRRKHTYMSCARSVRLRTVNGAVGAMVTMKLARTMEPDVLAAIVAIDGNDGAVNDDGGGADVAHSVDARFELALTIELECW